jgi:hypothetical protein
LLHEIQVAGRTAQLYLSRIQAPEFKKKIIRIGVVSVDGNITGEFKVMLPETPKRVMINYNHDILADREEVKRVK